MGAAGTPTQTLADREGFAAEVQAALSQRGGTGAARRPGQVPRALLTSARRLLVLTQSHT